MYIAVFSTFKAVAVLCRYRWVQHAIIYNCKKWIQSVSTNWHWTVYLITCEKIVPYIASPQLNLNIYSHFMAQIISLPKAILSIHSYSAILLTFARLYFVTSVCEIGHLLSLWTTVPSLLLNCKQYSIFVFPNELQFNKEKRENNILNYLFEFKKLSVASNMKH